mmetsp:Transcript_4778/g.11902  ORF Transcript_4778/g.11902 Transcript_4778/m.11902 type:complete len:167 (+) Transcript_4778:5525-6025(+)
MKRRSASRSSFRRLLELPGSSSAPRVSNPVALACSLNTVRTMPNMGSSSASRQNWTALLRSASVSVCASGSDGDGSLPIAEVAPKLGAVPRASVGIAAATGGGCAEETAVLEALSACSIGASAPEQELELRRFFCFLLRPMATPDIGLAADCGAGASKLVDAEAEV